jgi:hypothetical protein
MASFRNPEEAVGGIDAGFAGEGGRIAPSRRDPVPFASALVGDSSFT